MTIKITANTKIAEIKHLRSYTEARYGFMGGLKECKELIDGIQNSQKQAEEEKYYSLIKGLSLEELKLLSIKINETIHSIRNCQEY